MGVGFAIDLVVCSALGVDLFDCVYPTRTARFGVALCDKGQLNLKKKEFEFDQNCIDSDCTCYTCKNYTRSFLHTIASEEATGSTLLTIHNVAYQACFTHGVDLIFFN
jgi:tRNA-guanine family transglycosylase